MKTCMTLIAAAVIFPASILSLKGAESFAFAKSKPTLTVATYKSFVSDYGPGKHLKSSFEKFCKCELVWKTSADSGSLATDLKFGKYKAADVLVGFDGHQVEEIQKTKKVLASDFKFSGKLNPALQNTALPFLPIDFGYFAIVVNKEKLESKENLPTSFTDFLKDKRFKKNLAAQDPRTSSPGFGLIFWLRELSKDESEFKANLEKLKAQTLNFSKGWSESYGLFTKGETSAAFSYVSSELYHKLVDKKSNFVALPFKEGHHMQVEFAGVLKATQNKALAKLFMKHLHSNEAQSSIAQKNWMYPVTNAALESLPKEFKQSLAAIKPLPAKKMDDETSFQKKRKKLIQLWRSAF